MHTPPFSIRNTALHYLRLCVSQIFSRAELTIFTTASVITNTTRVLLLVGAGHSINQYTIICILY